jgi:hypothetical protein
MGISIIGGATPSARWQRTVRITGTQNFTIPLDVTEIEIILVAGGGGGGGGRPDLGQHGVGGAGSLLWENINVTPGSTHTVTIGGGGAGGQGVFNGVNNGAVGGTSSFGSLLSIAGGPGGAPTGLAGLGPAGRHQGGNAASSGANLNSTTQSFGYSYSATPGLFGLAGGGGTSAGLGGIQTAGGGAGGNNAGTPNTGGGGGGAQGQAGSGGSGIVILRYWSAL